MTDETPKEAEPMPTETPERAEAVEVVREKRAAGARIARGLVIAVIALIALIGVLLLVLNTSAGRRFVVSQIAALEFENGMQLRIGRIDGSLYDEMVIRNLEILDPKGVFLSADNIEMDWSPFAFIGNRLEIDTLHADRILLSRLPLFNETPPSDAPLLPAFDIHIGEMNVDQFEVAKAVTGNRHLATLSGRADVENQNLQLVLNGKTRQGKDLAGGDVLDLLIDTKPAENRLAVNLDLIAPADGMIAGLGGLSDPLTVTLTGKGDWKKWEGKLSAQLGEGSLAALELNARNGRFNIKGNSRPDLMLGPAMAGLFGPVTKINTMIALTDPEAETLAAKIDAKIGSEAFSFSADGEVDLSNDRFDNLAMRFLLLEPATLAENLIGRSVRADLVLDGAFATPSIDYKINAAAIGFNDIIVERLTASGTSRIDADRILIPINAKAGRIGGLDVAAGGTLVDVSIKGDLAMEGPRILSDNLRIKSDRIDANAIIVVDMSEGLYTGILEGRINNYRVESVGIFNVDTQADLESARDGGFVLKGRVRARSTQLFNDGVREFLGGNTLIAADLSYGTDGVARVTRLSVGAPAFRLNGSGSYAADGGTISLAATGNSDAYGPLALNVSGTLGAPVARLRAERPGLGVGLVNLEALLTGSAKGYDITAKGDTDYGPVNADLLILTGSGPLTIDIKMAQFAGVDMRGRVVQQATGPFAGTLSANGSGVNGSVQLSAAGDAQAAKVDMQARNALFSGAAGDIRIGRAIIKADIVLYEQPDLTAAIQLGEVQIGNLDLNAARADINYRRGRGSAKAVAEGYNGVPFRIATNAVFTPQMWQVALKGRANSIDFKTRKNARIAINNGIYELRPTVLELESGSVQLAGKYGKGLEIQSRLNAVDLSILNAFSPGLGLGGKANGSLDFAQATINSFPSADARLKIDGFTRTSLAAMSQPVDISMVGRLLPDGGNMRGILRRRGAIIGRLQADLKPLPPGAGPWQERLLAAPLSGGIRYNGPAATLFSFAALPSQSMGGSIGVAADFSGRVRAPRLNGLVRSKGLSYENELYGTRLTNMRVEGRFTNDRLDIETLSAKAGEGSISGSGYVGLAAEKGFPMELDFAFENARLAESDDIAATATGNLKFVNPGGNTPAQIAANRPKVSGTVQLPETRYRVIRQGAAEVARLTGVRRKPPSGRRKITGDATLAAALPLDWDLDIKINADDQLYVSGMGLESEWASDLRLRGSTAAPRITGDITLLRGTFGFAGRSFALERGGRISFNGGSTVNPVISLTASAVVEDVTTFLTIAGQAFNPQITFSSTPSLPQDEIMARILFGSSIGNLSAIQAVQLASSLNALRGSGGGLNPMGKIQSATGVDRLRILGADEKTGRGTALAAGQYITDDIYLEIITDTRGFTATQLEVTLTPSLSVLSKAGSFGSNSVSLQYRKDY